METTIQLDDQLLNEANALAAQSGTSLSAVINNALRQALSNRRPVAPIGNRVKLKTHGAGGLQPGVDLNNTLALLDLLDEPHAAS